MLGKRGVSESAIDWMVALVIASIALVFVAVLVNSFDSEITTKQLEAEVFIAKVYYELGVDFDSSQLQNDLFEYDESPLAAKITVDGQSWYQDKDLFERMLPLKNVNHYYTNFTYPVVVDGENEQLLIEVLV